MANFNILTSSVPLGGVALANIGSFLGNAREDVDSVQVELFDYNSTSISDETWSGTNVSAAASDGGAITITDPAGSGTYQWTYAVPNDGTYAPTASGLSFSIRITITEGTDTRTETFTFKIVPTTLDISLDTSSVIEAIKRQGGLTAERGFVLNSGESIISLGREIVYALDSVLLNGSAATAGTEYGWVSGRPNITLTAASSANDFWQIAYQTSLSTTAIEDYITEATRTILSKLRAFYDDTALATYPTVANLIKDRALGRIRMDLAEGVALESAQFRSGRDMVTGVMRHLGLICNGSAEVLDDSGTVVVRREGSLAGAFFDPTRGAVENTQDVRKRLAAFTGFALNFYPLDPGDVISSR